MCMCMCMCMLSFEYKTLCNVHVQQLKYLSVFLKLLFGTKRVNFDHQCIFSYSIIIIHYTCYFHIPLHHIHCLSLVHFLVCDIYSLNSVLTQRKTRLYKRETSCDMRDTRRERDSVVLLGHTLRRGQSWRGTEIVT